MTSIDNRTRVYRGMGAQTIVTICLGILGITYFSIMSRLLTKEDFGYYAIVTAITSILASLSEAGLGAAIIQNKEANEDYIRTSWSISIIIGLLFTAFLFLSSGVMSYIFVGSNALQKCYQLMSVILLFYAINGVGRAVLMKQLKFLQYGLFDIVAYMLSSLVGILMAYYEFGVYSVLIAMLLHQVFLCIQICVINSNLLRFSINASYVSQIISFGGWLTGSVIIRNITDQLDKLITRKWIPVAELGAYNRPVGLQSQITGYVNGVFDTILFPILSNINNDTHKISSAYLKSTYLVSLFSIILSAFFILCDEIFISIFLGEKWMYLSAVFQIVSISIAFLSFSRLADCFFRSLGKVKQYFYVRLLVMVSTCVSMFVGSHYGIVGLAIGLLLSRILDAVFKGVYLYRNVSINMQNVRLVSYKYCCVPILIFTFCYLIKVVLPFGTYISVLLFTLVLLYIIVFRPMSLGQIFYDNVYTQIDDKIRKYFYTNEKHHNVCD